MSRNPILGLLPSGDVLQKAKIRSELLKPFFDPIICRSRQPIFEKEVTIEKLFNARVHFGHKIGTLNENMRWALYGDRLGVCVFDLEITRKYMLKALEFIRALAYSKGRFLFVTTNKSAILLVEEFAELLGQYAHTRPWQQGTFINAKRLFRGPVRLPDAVVFLNTQTSALDRHPALIEAAKMCIPSVAIVDSNCEPNYVTYPIPGNDDSIASIQFYMEIFAKAIRLGQQEGQKVSALIDGSDKSAERQEKTRERKTADEPIFKSVQI